MKSHYHLLFSCLLGLSLCQCASHTPQTTYDNFKSFYVSYPNRVFSPTDEKNLQMYADMETKQLAGYWVGIAEGEKLYLDLKEYTLTLYSREKPVAEVEAEADRRKTITFPGIGIGLDELPYNADFYLKKPYLCIEGLPFSSSGYAAFRYNNVYLMKFVQGKKAELYKLPEFFNSCLNLRLDKEGHIVFYVASRADDPPDDTHTTGLILEEYRLVNEKFEVTGKKLKITFAPPNTTLDKFTKEDKFSVETMYSDPH